MNYNHSLSILRYWDLSDFLTDLCDTTLNNFVMNYSVYIIDYLLELYEIK